MKGRRKCERVCRPDHLGAWNRLPAPHTEIDFLLSPSAKQCGNPCSGAPYHPFSFHKRRGLSFEPTTLESSVWGWGGKSIHKSWTSSFLHREIGNKNEKLLRLLLSWPQLSILDADHKDHNSGSENGGLSSYQTGRKAFNWFLFMLGWGLCFSVSQAPDMKNIIFFLFVLFIYRSKIQSLSFYVKLNEYDIVNNKERHRVLPTNRQCGDWSTVSLASISSMVLSTAFSGFHSLFYLSSFTFVLINQVSGSICMAARGWKVLVYQSWGL